LPGRSTKTPWHLWVIAVAAFLWNAAGAFTIMMAQAGTLYDLEPGERAYYAAQPVWFVILTDMSLIAAVAASIALLLRRRAALHLFAFSFAAVLITNGYELAAGTSRMLVTRAALIVTILIAAIALFEVAYTWAMKRRSVLDR
jgi:hypothetical protein